MGWTVQPEGTVIMTKEQHPHPDDSNDSTNQVTILNPDGSVQHRYAVSDVQKTPRPKKVQKSRPEVGAARIVHGAVPRDNSSALKKRLDAKAAESAEEKAEELSEAIYAKFMNLLSESIMEKGGNLTMDDVAEMGEAFNSQLGEIKETFLSAVESYTHAREENRVNTERGNVFHRVMSHSFEHNLVPEKQLKDAPENMSRRMLPGFYNAMSMMFGPPKLARYEEKTKLAVDRLLKESNGQIEWEEVYVTPEIRRISLRSQIDIARHFKNTEKRLDWLIAMVNSNMIPLEEGKRSSGWSFTRETAENLLTFLFKDLHAALQNQGTRQRFTAELGAETVTILDTVTKRFS